MDDIPKKKTACESKIFDIDSVVQDMNNVNVFLALSRKQNAIQIFETKGKNDAFSCKSLGVLRFKDSAKLNSLHI